MEKFQRRIKDIYCGSIFIAISCPNEESLIDLRYQLENGELRRIVLVAFEIDQLLEQSKFKSLEVTVNLKEIRKPAAQG